MSTPFTQDEINTFVADWYKLLDVHAPLESYKPLIADNFVLTVPEFTVEGWEGFKGWYERAIGLFFDEVHEVKSAEIVGTEGDITQVKVVVRWEASRWIPPAATSDRIIMDAYQTWHLTRSAAGTPVFVKYIVDKAEYAEGSATL